MEPYIEQVMSGVYAARNDKLYTMHSVSQTSLGLPLKVFHYDFDFFDVCSNSTKS